MESKYYTPKIEEFHVGFEYEYQRNGFWYKDITNDLYECYDIWKDHESERHPVRVNYLCQEDIESLGFEVSGLGTYPENEEYLFGVPSLMKDDGSTGNGYWLKFWKKTGKVEITDCTQILHTRLFDGTIKNKSELKKVLKMIGYEKG